VRSDTVRVKTNLVPTSREGMRSDHLTRQVVEQPGTAYFPECPYSNSVTRAERRVQFSAGRENSLLIMHSYGSQSEALSERGYPATLKHNGDDTRQLNHP
jgi:hypothetical protein